MRWLSRPEHTCSRELSERGNKPDILEEDGVWFARPVGETDRPTADNL